MEMNKFGVRHGIILPAPRGLAQENEIAEMVQKCFLEFEQEVTEETETQQDRVP